MRPGRVRRVVWNAAFADHHWIVARFRTKLRCTCQHLVWAHSPPRLARREKSASPPDGAATTQELRPARAAQACQLPAPAAPLRPERGPAGTGSARAVQPPVPCHFPDCLLDFPSLPKTGVFFILKPTSKKNSLQTFSEHGVGNTKMRRPRKFAAVPRRIRAKCATCSRPSASRDGGLEAPAGHVRPLVCFAADNGPAMA